MQRTNSQSSSGSAQPCSGSILLNPLPGAPSASGTTSAVPRSPPPAVSGSLASASTARPRRPSVAVCVSATAEPPAWYQAENGGAQPGTPYGSPPKGSSKSRSNSADRWGIDSDDSGDERPATGSRGRLPNGKETSIQFAPLPQGRQRSNSITIGVASRAHMLNAQGGAVNGQQQYSRQARYAGPQWYQTGGVVPPDVYTYKDLARGLSNVWRKAKNVRRPSTTSTTSSTSVEQALDMERDAKSKGAIEHIEEAEEEHDNDDDEDDEHALADSDSDLEVEKARGRALGMSMGAFRAGSVESSSSGEGSGVSEASGALSTSATSAGTAEVGEAKWEAEAEARRARKGKGKAVGQGV